MTPSPPQIDTILFPYFPIIFTPDHLDRLSPLFIDHLKSIYFHHIATKIQQFWRRHRSSPIQYHNDIDFYTFDPIDQIAPIYRFQYIENDHDYYMFDIRTIHKWLTYSNRNPFTNQPISTTQIDLIRQRIAILISMGHPVDMPDPTLVQTPRQRFESRVIQIVDTMNQSGYQVQSGWLIDLSVPGYRRLIDGMSRYVTPSSIPPITVDDLHDICLTMLEQLIQMPDQMGIMVFLSIFVTISRRCAQTFPYLL